MSNTTSNSGGIGFFGLLTVVFITLKLTHVIAWSWWLVLLPILAPIAVLIAILVVILIIAAIATLIE